jgi:hypothetical protein
LSCQEGPVGDHSGKKGQTDNRISKIHQETPELLPACPFLPSVLLYPAAPLLTMVFFMLRRIS